MSLFTAAALMSEAERQLAQCPWKEYSDGGKTYYVALYHDNTAGHRTQACHAAARSV